jgi:hypothetical protein
VLTRSLQASVELHPGMDCVHWPYATLFFAFGNPSVFVLFLLFCFVLFCICKEKYPKMFHVILLSATVT